MFTHLVHVPYCYDFLVNQIPMGLLLYSHLPVAMMALIFSTYVLVKARNFPSFLLFLICVIFTIWASFDLSAWFAFLGAGNTMFTWSLLDFTAGVMFFFTYYFLYTFVSGNDLPLWQKIAALVILIPPAVVAFLGLNIPTYDLNTCTALENEKYTRFIYLAEAVFILASATFVVRYYRRTSDKVARRRTLLAGTGVLIFMLVFFSASFLVSLYASSSISSYVYNYLIYGLFGMPVFLIYLGYLIVRYKAFNMKMFGAQALVAALVLVLASEYAFINTLTDRILVAVTLVLTAITGMILIRSVRREIEQREHIEALARDLAKANDQQVVLIHFITHQIKGFVTKSRNIFAGLLEGDYGPLTEAQKPLIEEGFRSDTQGASTIQQILDASNLKSGKVTYTFAPVDLKALIEKIMGVLKPAADAKKLELSFQAEDGATVSGDALQLENAFKNLIDNAIKYTPSGSIHITLGKEEGKLVYRQQDTGVGITPEDKQKLFTEGGHGADSTKVNVDSTGYGLYIVKNIIEAHHGHVWAESEGAGTGSTFIVELPA